VAAPRFQDEARIQGGLRQLLVSLDLDQLLVVRGWLHDQLRLERERPSMRLVRVPDVDDGLLGKIDANTLDRVELLAEVRVTITSLPRGHLAVLLAWLERELDRR
jgi:hypothetical protein